jgi:hypothetical protein
MKNINTFKKKPQNELTSTSVNATCTLKPTAQEHTRTSDNSMNLVTETSLKHNITLSYSYSTTNKMHLLSQIIYSCKTLYMFWSIFRPLSGAQNCVYSNGICQKAAAIGDEMELRKIDRNM